MSHGSIINIIVAGTGGQGVFTLSNIIRKLAVNKGLKCEGATYKGGAQRMGSIHSELRILTDKNSDLQFSSSIPAGAVHLLIGMEPWEALRFADRCNEKSNTVINSNIEKLYVERIRKNKLMDPVETLKTVFKAPVISNYEQLAKEELEQTNFIMLKTAIANGYLPFTIKELEAIKIKK
ncbi:MAG: 2-oxoacid:acceptor oxidoreductase family protein [Salibacteraceae bacterium]